MEKLPSENLSLFHGRGVSVDAVGRNTSNESQSGAKGPSAKGPSIAALECVQIYKNGGVGALGEVGKAATALKPQMWMWVTIVRKDGELKTYVNGNLCADVKVCQKFISHIKIDFIICSLVSEENVSICTPISYPKSHHFHTSSRIPVQL